MNNILKLAPCIVVLLTGSVFAQDCTMSDSMGDQFWQSRKERVEIQYDLDTWKAPPDKSAGALIKRNLLDRITLSTSYGDGYQISTEGTGIVFDPKEKNDWTWLIKYEIPLGSFFPDSTPQQHPNKQYFKDSTINKAKIEFDNLIADWRIANSTLERRKAELESKTTAQDKKIAAWAVEEARHTVDKLSTQIKNLSGQKIASNTCI